MLARNMEREQMGKKRIRLKDIVGNPYNERSEEPKRPPQQRIFVCSMCPFRLSSLTATLEGMAWFHGMVSSECKGTISQLKQVRCHDCGTWLEVGETTHHCRYPAKPREMKDA